MARPKPKRRARPDRSTRRTSPNRSIRQLQRALATLTTDAPPEDVTRARAAALLTHLASVDTPILIANHRARYVDVNAAAVKWTGYSRRELLRMAVWDLTPTPRRDLGLRLWRAFLRRGQMAGRYTIRRRDGTLAQADYVAIAHVLPGVHVSALVSVPARRT